VLLDHMKDKQHAAQLKELLLCALLAGQLASELTAQARDAEESYLGALLYRLGRLLTEFYLPEEARAIRDELRPHAARSNEDAPTAEQASQRVLGVGFEQLGIGVARAWGLPDSLQQCMRSPAGEPPTRPVQAAGERMRWLARGANEMAEALMQGAGPASARMEGLVLRYASALGKQPQELIEALQTSRTKLRGMAQAIGLSLPTDSPARGLMETTTSAVPDAAGNSDADAATLVMSAPDSMPPARPASEVLTAGIQDITHTLAQESFRLNEVLRMILETIYRGLGFRCVVFALRDPKTAMLTGRFGLGEGVQALVSQFAVRLGDGRGPAQDLLGAICQKGADTLIADATASNVAGRLPPWLQRTDAARTFLLLPLVMKGATFALIYADRAQPGSIAAGEKELSLLRTLRSQAVMAFRQAT
jgi:hypothetical protein